jgi:hypothetical protein
VARARLYLTACRVRVWRGACTQFITRLELTDLETVVMTYRLEGDTPAGKLDMVRCALSTNMFWAV